MLQRTYKKLREAKFFLSAAYDEEQKVLFEKEPEALEFYLSAFVSAGRSVTFAMSKDAGGSTEQWTVDWIARLPTADDRKLMEFFNRQRVNTIHRGDMDVEESVTTVPFAEFVREISMGGAATSFVTSPPGTPQPSFDRIELKFKGLPDGSAIGFCRRYIELVTNLVADFERDQTA
jgi:hypothetical protein